MTKDTGVESAATGFTDSRAYSMGDEPANGTATAVIEHMDEEEQKPLMEEEGNPTAGQVIEEWSGGTSVHGVALAFDSQSFRIWYRLLWGALVLTALALMVWQIESLIRQYRSFEVVTDTITIVPETMEFPEITVCNTNIVSKWRSETSGITSPASENELFQVTTPVSEFVVYAAFNGREILNISEAFAPIVTDYGVCWQFKTTERIVRPGQFGGLDVYVYLNQWDYMPDTDLAGAMVFALTPGTNINTQLPFTTISPGKSANLRLKKSHYGREKQAPWARCHSEAPAYTQEQCRRNCLYREARMQCGCRGWGDRLEPQETRLCYSQPVEDGACIFNLEQTLDGIRSCTGTDCSLPPCVETEYAVDMTDADPSDVFLSSLFGLYNLTQEDFLKNFASIHVNFDRIRFEEFTESKALTLNQLLGSIGGSMGLFLGISALSVFEIFGDLCIFRLIPRCFGYGTLHGIGGR
uniref:Uncharacterized protein n=1 Tax=Entomoneis paludosa TaxID=265537 RepID=A0A7S2YC09_9STRA|mmetsp:Transcript_26650/g.55801  ORF Transcript_26650/g.55801 Transcript_26650/m.55801 type:complete len:468 (+) Transcript_26650:46-1449(+)